jgi:hypothetical protein
MRNHFSAPDPVVEVDPTFAAQAGAQRGGTPTAPSCNPVLPEHQPVALPPALEAIVRTNERRQSWKKLTP